MYYASYRTDLLGTYHTGNQNLQDETDLIVIGKNMKHLLNQVLEIIEI
jgi:hypothetical protein